MEYDRIATCADRIKEALTIKGLKQSDLCRLTGIPKSAISQYISGAFEPKQDRVYLLSKALNVSETWLMGLDVPIERIQNTPPESEPLTEGEKILIDLFRRVPEDQQQLVLQMIRAALGTQE